MKQPSAGILLYRKQNGGIEVMLVHPGGPFWAKKDAGAWSIPKGRHESEEDAMTAAKREFEEETGQAAPEGDYIDLGEFKRPDGTMVKAWGVESDFEVSKLKSNLATINWPPGQQTEVPEVDRAEWFAIDKAPAKLHKGQDIFIERLAKHLGHKKVEPPEQAKLL